MSEQIASPKLCLANDRTIFKWQKYAGRFDEKTIDGHLAAIRVCENVTSGKRFDRFSVEDAAKVRDDLKRRLSKDAEDHLSTSTVRHIVSHLTLFFGWLLKQEGSSRLPKDLPDYFKLPKAPSAATLPRAPRAFPTIQEAEQMLCDMPSKTLVERRARAIFAVAFLGALRADTVISLRVKHVDVSGRRIIQDGTELRSKNGKSENIFWFRIPECFANEVVRWNETLQEFGFRDSDAFFPSSDWLLETRKRMHRGDRSIPVMSTKHAVTQAFAVASRNSEIHYSPHSAKHTIGALRDEKRMTHRQRKAWSENMGHENERITETHYAKFSDEQRYQVLESIGQNEDLVEANFSDEEKIAMFNGILAQIKRR